jgi:hypothetical protein
MTSSKFFSQRLAAAALTVGVLGGCAVRSPEMYRDDTRKLLSNKQPVLAACYDAELQNNRDAAGKVIVHFVVERDTGRVLNPKIDDLLSTPNRTLRGCVLDSMRDLVLSPPDERNGDATFTWEFKLPEPR